MSQITLQKYICYLQILLITDSQSKKKKLGSVVFQTR